MKIQFKLILVGFVVIAVLMAVAWYVGVLSPISIIVAILLIVGMAFFVSQMLARPIQELRNVVDAVSRGDLKKRAKVEGKDELSRLAQSLNIMIEGFIEARRLPENILRSMKDSLFVVDTKGNITEVNQAALEALGYKKEEIVGKPISKVFGKIKTGTAKAKKEPKAIKYIPAPDQEQE